MSRFTVPAKKSFDDTSVILLHTDRQKNKSAALKKIAGEILLDQQIACLKKVISPNIDISLVLGYDARGVIAKLDRKVRVVLNEKFDETDMATSIFIGLLSTISSNVFIIDGSLPLNEEHFIPNNESYVMVNQNKNGSEIGAVITKNKIVNFAYGVENKTDRVMHLDRYAIDCFLSNYDDKLILCEILNLMLENGVLFTPIFK